MLVLSKVSSWIVNHRCLSTSGRLAVKVCVCGAGGGIGQPLSMLLKLSPLVSELSLYDIVHTPGVVADLSHIDTNSKTIGCDGPENLKVTLTGMEVVIIPAGVPRKPGMTRDDLFNTNASIVRDLTEAIAKYCPKALVAIITNPVNTCVPIAAETLKKHGVFDPNRLFGVTTLDLIRARTFVGQLKGLDPASIDVPVIGGHSGVTIIPVISQTKPQIKLDDDEVVALSKRIQNAGSEVVKAKAGSGSATLSMAHAGARFALSLCRGLKGEKDVIECSYVSSKVTEAKFFATSVLLGPNGVAKNFGLPSLSNYEKELLKAAMPELQKNIKKGEDFVTK